MNFKSFGNDAGGGGDGGGRPGAGSFSLTRQPSVYSLTFDEFMSSMGGSGKDCGSMNMDELLKNIWTAEEVQTITAAGEEGGVGVSHLQRQGSLTLPRTLSQKTVDEVWKDISKDYGNQGGPNLVQTQRQPTLGEVTLEEFLLRAGVVREDMKHNNEGVFVDLSRAAAAAAAGNNSGLGLGFQQMNKVTGLMGNRLNNDPLVGLQPSSNLPLNVNGVRSSNQQQQMQSPQSQHQHQHQQHQQQQQQQIFPKQPAMSSYAAQMPQGMRGGMVGLGGDQGLNGSLVQGGGIGMVGLAPGPVHVTATGSPAANQMSGDKIGKSNGDTSSVSPVPYVFNGGFRGRKSGGAVEKVIERRQRRMIKNRESAARSRARKQAYTMELEAEVAKLKEENQELQKKQAEIMEVQKNQVKEMMNLQREVKRRRIRRTQTGPW